MGFKLSPNLNKSERGKVLRALKKFHKENEKIENANKAVREFNSTQKYKKDYMKLQRLKPGTKVIKDLKKRGLNYDKNNMYFDIRRSGATYNAKTSEKRARAAKWFDEYFEPMRQKKKVSSKKAYDIWKRAKEQSYENMTQSELEFALELRELGSP